MSNFQERREEYYNKLKNNKELLNTIIEAQNKKEKGQRNIEILVTPENERELSIAESLFSITNDTLFFVEQALDNNIKRIPAEENIALKIICRFINELESGKTDIEFMPEDATGKLQAKIMYDLILSSVIDTEDVIKYIAKETGYDLEDKLDRVLLLLYISKAKRLSNESNVSEKNFDDMTDKDVETFTELAKEFRRLIADGIININDYSISEEEAKVYQKTKE